MFSSMLTVLGLLLHTWRSLRFNADSSVGGPQLSRTQDGVDTDLRAVGEDVCQRLTGIMYKLS